MRVRQEAQLTLHKVLKPALDLLLPYPSTIKEVTAFDDRLMQLPSSHNSNFANLIDMSWPLIAGHFDSLKPPNPYNFS